MKTAAQIAKEAADKVVHVRVNDEGDRYPVIHKDPAAVILAAIEEARTQSPVPSPVSDRRLDEARQIASDWLNRGAHPSPSTAALRLCDLLDHLDFLHAIMNGSEAEAYRAGLVAGRAKWFAEGAEAQRRATVEAVNAEADRYPDIGTAYAVANAVAAKVCAIPTARLREEE